MILKERCLPLQGIKVIDLSRLFPGPLSTLILSDMGAEVIKIESPSGNVDLLRKNPPIFHSLNRGKKSIALNLQQSKDRESLFKLLDSADVLVESFRPGVFEKLLNIKNVQNLLDMFPQSRISAFGQNQSEFKHVPAHLGFAGIYHLSNFFHPLPLQAVDLLTAYSCANQIVAAIILRSKDNKGSFIDVSMYDMAVTTGILALSDHFSSKRQISNGKDELTGRPCYDIYKTKDGYISVGCLEPHFWKSFVGLIGLENLSNMSNAFATGDDALKIRKMIEEKLSVKTSKEWEDFFIDPKRSLPIMRVRKPEDLYGDETLKQRKMISIFKKDDEEFMVLKPGLDYVNFLKKSQNNTGGPNIGENNDILQSKL